MDKKRLLEPTGMDVGEFLAALTEYEACYPDDRRVEIARGWAIWRAATPAGWEPDNPEQALQHRKLRVDLKIMFAGLHFLQGGDRLVQIGPPLPGHAHVVVNVLRSGALSYYDTLAWKARRQAMSPAERRRYSCVEWADQEVCKARAKGHEPNSTAVGILHRLGLIDARGRVLYPTSDPGERNARLDASDA
jgi:hypothetical protein